MNFGNTASSGDSSCQFAEIAARVGPFEREPELDEPPPADSPRSSSPISPARRRRVGLRCQSEERALSRPSSSPWPAPFHYIDDFGQPRPGGTHEGNDLMAVKKTPAVAVEPGRSSSGRRLPPPAACSTSTAKSGTTYDVHPSEQRPDDEQRQQGQVRPRRVVRARTEGRREGQAGQMIGYVGDSGDANGIHAHLHFEVHPNDARCCFSLSVSARARSGCSSSRSRRHAVHPCADRNGGHRRPTRP